MAKYSKLTQGQIEAIVNKLGGMIGVKHFLSDGSPILDREQCAYMRGYDTTKVLRDLLRGWGDYQTGSERTGATLSVLISCLTERTQSLSRDMLENKAGVSDEQEIRNLVLEEIELARTWIIEFQVREDIRLEGVESHLLAVRTALQKGDYIAAFEEASNLVGFWNGITWLIDRIRPQV